MKERPNATVAEQSAADAVRETLLKDLRQLAKGSLAASKRALKDLRSYRELLEAETNVQKVGVEYRKEAECVIEKLRESGEQWSVAGEGRKRKRGEGGGTRATKRCGLLNAASLYEESTRWTSSDPARTRVLTELAAQCEYECAIAVCLLNGWGGMQADAGKAVERLTKLAEQGDDAVAQNSLAHCYEYGNGVEKDLAQAADLYRKSADQGYARAQCTLAYCYEYAQGWRRTCRRRSSCTASRRTRGMRGHSATCLLLLSRQRGGEGHVEGGRVVPQVGGPGVCEGTVQLGLLLLSRQRGAEGPGAGGGVVPQVGGPGYARAQCTLAYCYEYGKGVEQGMAKAVKCTGSRRGGECEGTKQLGFLLRVRQRGAEGRGQGGGVVPQVGGGA